MQCFIAKAAIQSGRSGGNELHEPLTFATTTEGFARVIQRREGRFEQAFHQGHFLYKVPKLSFEYGQGMIANGAKVGFASGDLVELLLHGRPHGGQDQVWIDLLVAMDEKDA